MDLESSEESNNVTKILLEVSFVEGLGNEIVIALAIVLLMSPLTIFLIRRCLRRVQQFYTNMQGRVADMDQNQVLIPRREISQDERCPICLDGLKFACMTSCGHFFCGNCIRQVYIFNYQRVLPIYCPVCRQEVASLFTCFTDEENILLQDSQATQTLTRVVIVFNFVQVYNHMATQANSISFRAIHVQNIVRRMWDDFFLPGGLMRVRWRMHVCICLCTFTLYLLAPYDLIPEVVFGLFGLVDDFLILVFLCIYLYSFYRNRIDNDDPIVD